MPHIEPKQLIDAESLSSSEILSNGYFRIPMNQRDYRWEEDNWKDLWNDITILCDSNFIGASPTPPDQRKPHFMGAIVVIRNTRSIGGRERGEIADGQQRLATLNVLYATLIKRIDLSSLPDKADIRARLSTCLYSSDSGGKTWRLQLDKEKTFFETSLDKYVTGIAADSYWSTITDYNRRPIAARIKKAFEFFDTAITDYVASKSEAELENIITISTEALTFIKTTVYQRGIAYRLFETMNYRGLDLTLADLIKNKVLEVSEAQGTHENCTQQWLDLQKEIEIQSITDGNNTADESKKLKEFIHLAYISCHDTIKLEDLYDEITAHLAKPAISAEGYTSEILSEAKNLTKILNAPSGPLKDASKYAKELLETLSINYSIPLILAAANRFSGDDVQLTRCVKAARDFCFRFFTIGSNSVSKLQSEVGNHSRMLRNPANSADTVINSLRSKAPSSLFKSEFSTARLKLNKHAFYVMESIENHISGGAGLAIFTQGPTQHLEHILPKRLGSNWPLIDIDHHDEYLFRIGNLVALEANINTHIKNKSFSEKQSNTENKGYEDSTLTLPGEISAHLEGGNWTFGSITKRQEHLANTYILDVWPLD